MNCRQQAISILSLSFEFFWYVETSWSRRLLKGQWIKGRRTIRCGCSPLNHACESVPVWSRKRASRMKKSLFDQQAHHAFIQLSRGSWYAWVQRVLHCLAVKNPSRSPWWPYLSSFATWVDTTHISHTPQTANRIVDILIWFKCQPFFLPPFFYPHLFCWMLLNYALNCLSFSTPISCCNDACMYIYVLHLVQSKNWDGGLQERQTVIDAIADIFPGAGVEAHCKNAYPLRLKVHAKINNEGEEGKDEKIKIWDGDQKRLFKKNPEMRAECVEEIQAALQKLRNDMNV